MRAKQSRFCADAGAASTAARPPSEVHDGQWSERDLLGKMPLRYLAGSSLAVQLALAGCSHAPEYTIFGSFFPVWIFCSVGGLLLMAGTRVLISRTAVAEYIAVPVLSYLSMATVFACALWLLFYR